jgi:hypothetical protein
VFELRDLNIDSFPDRVSARAGWTSTWHSLSYPPEEWGDEFRPIEYQLVSKKDRNDIPRLYYFAGSAGRPWTWARAQAPFEFSIVKSDWLGPISRHLKTSSHLDIGTIYDLLTGHYLLAYHRKLFESSGKTSKWGAVTDEAIASYWSPLATESGGVTKLTVKIYQELIAWGEASSPSLMSILMNTGPRTIHTRLQEARKLGILLKPGTGARKSKSMYEQTLEN